MSIKMKFRGKNATTLIELLIAVTIFSIVAITAASVMINTLQSTKKIQNQVFLYSEAQALMDQLARYVEQNGVDYEAYYDREVQDATGWSTENYGQYAMTFYDPGAGGPETGPYASVGGYGAYCSGSFDAYPDECTGSAMPDYSTLDQDMGAHPFPDIGSFDASMTDDPDFMNAFCEYSGGSDDCTGLEHFVSHELILINGEGDERTVFALESSNAGLDHRLSEVQLTGEDSDGDGIVDNWQCAGTYTCTYTAPDGDAVPDPDDIEVTLESTQRDFMPITPSTIDIQNFYVYIAPVEDPYRAFAEENAQIQPQVTIVFTAALSDSYAAGLLGEVPSITIERTVSTGIYEKIVSW